MNDSVILPTTKEEALAAGVPEDVFDPEVHLFSKKVEFPLPSAIIANAEAPSDVGE